MLIMKSYQKFDPFDFAYAHVLSPNPANNYLLKVNNRNTRKTCKICSKLTIKTPQQHLLTFKQGVLLYLTV